MSVSPAPAAVNMPISSIKIDLLNFLLKYAQQLQSLSAIASGQEAHQAWQQIKVENTLKNRLKLVLLHGFAHASQRNDKLALELLENSLSRAGNSEPLLSAYLRFLQHILIDRLETDKRVQTMYTTLEQRVRQERKERLELLEQRSNLQHKLEALKNIEKSLNDRSKPPRLDKP
jgi:hypothetical protein